MYDLYKSKEDDVPRYLIVYKGRGWMFTAPYVETALHQVSNRQLAWDFDESEYIGDWDRVGESFNSANEVRMYMLLGG